MARSVLVVGLGRFGTAAALELMRLGNEVLAVDLDEERVNELAPDVTHAVQLDASDDEALRSVGAGDFEHAIVAISGDTRGEHLRDDGAQDTRRPERRGEGRQPRCTPQILSRVGADRVVFAEARDGRGARPHLRDPRGVDYLDVAPRFGIAKVPPPAAFVGRRWASSRCCPAWGSRPSRSGEASR